MKTNAEGKKEEKRMRGIIWINGIGLEAEEVEEIRKAIWKINRRRKKAKCEEVDYVFTNNKKMYLNAKLAKRYRETRK